MKIAQVQMHVCDDKRQNIRRACELIRKAAAESIDMAILPEMFCCPYDNGCFRRYGEAVGGEAQQALSALAKELGIYLVGGSVPELADGKVIDGYADGSFKHNNTITYGAALKLIMLAAGYPEQKPTGANAFSGYLTKARAEGIVTRSNVELNKPITRLQVARLAAGAMKLDKTNLSSVKPFTDTDDPSVQALNAAGIVEGYFSGGTSVYKPNNTLTRGQVSAIVWRMRNYQK